MISYKIVEVQIFIHENTFEYIYKTKTKEQNSAHTLWDKLHVLNFRSPQDMVLASIVFMACW